MGKKVPNPRQNRPKLMQQNPRHIPAEGPGQTLRCPGLTCSGLGLPLFNLAYDYFNVEAILEAASTKGILKPHKGSTETLLLNHDVLLHGISPSASKAQNFAKVPFVKCFSGVALVPYQVPPLPLSKAPQLTRSVLCEKHVCESPWGLTNKHAFREVPLVHKNGNNKFK